MSLSGNTYYSTQNLQNEYPMQSIENDVATNTANIAINTADIATNTDNIATNTANIATNTSNIATNTSSIATNTSDITSNTSNVSSILQRITDITYNSGVDTTYINNRVTIRSTIDSATSAAPQITLWNTTTQAPNQVIYSIMAGVENGSWSNLSREGDCLMLTRNRTGVAGS